MLITSDTQKTDAVACQESLDGGKRWAEPKQGLCYFLFHFCQVEEQTCAPILFAKIDHNKQNHQALEFHIKRSFNRHTIQLTQSY